MAEFIGNLMRKAGKHPYTNCSGHASRAAEGRRRLYMQAG